MPSLIDWGQLPHVHIISPLFPAESQQYVTVLLPGGPGTDPQYAQLPADPRVLSGQCSYAVIPQPDGSSQIALVETSSLTTTGATATTTTTTSQSVVEMDCPAPALMDNDYESQPWSVDITLMYADSPLPFLREQKEEVKEVESKKKPSELLQQIDRGNTVHNTELLTHVHVLIGVSLCKSDISNGLAGVMCVCVCVCVCVC